MPISVIKVSGNSHISSPEFTLKVKSCKDVAHKTKTFIKTLDCTIPWTNVIRSDRKKWMS